MEDNFIIDEPKKEFKFTEEYIQKRLNNFFAVSTQKYVLENLYIFKWESDKFIETHSGLIYEFEIKISKSDFKHDFDKKDKHVILEGKEPLIPSYEEVSKRAGKWGSIIDDKWYRTENFKKPNYFYYAVPEGMIGPDEVPSYAGLIYVLPGDRDETADGRLCWDRFYVVKKAPKLHDTKYTDEELNLSEKFYYNMLSWKQKCWEEKEKRLLTEENKIPYAEMQKRMEKAENENKALKILVNTESKTKELFAETMENDMHLLRAYREKIRELSPGFNWIDFEDKILEEYD